MSFTEKSLLKLELNEVLTLLSHEAVSDTAKDMCLSIRPSGIIEEVKRLITETNCACSFMSIKGAPSFYGIKDIRPSIERAKLGGSLSCKELLEIAGLLRCSRLVKSYISDDKLEKSSIDYLFNSIHSNKYLEQKISDCILSEDEISDSASPELSDLRRKMRAASTNAREALQRILSSSTYSKALQENIITTRAGRFVVPVKSECRGDIPGLVHDVSSTGATLFVEPMGAVKANNELRELTAKEKLEIEKILACLSSECADFGDEITEDFLVLVKLDVIFAKAKLSFSLDCVPAEYNEKILSLKKARHPLLNKKTVVPLDVIIGETYDTLIITGPNTGGKTVALKTIGLLAAMNQCGLHIPANDGSMLPIFSNFLADIGDEQSIEQSLSTFSAHMKNIVEIIGVSDNKSLVLFDELGAGTDPVEGAALAVAIIEKIRKIGAMVVATTHYTELKIYASNENSVQNASCEFDVETLQPTYRLLIGIPGKSNAFAIAERLGLNKAIISDAKQRIDSNNVSLENTIEKLENARQKLEDDRKKIQSELQQATEKERLASLLKAEHEVRLEKSELKAKREAEQIIKEARKTAEEVFAELDEMRSKINEEDDINRINEERSLLRQKLNLAEDSVKTKYTENDMRVSSRSLMPGDFVEVKSNGLKGVVSNVENDGFVNVKAGNINIRIKECELYLHEGTNVQKSNRGQSHANHIVLNDSCVKSEIDLRGMDSLEAVICAERFIDDAVMNGLDTCCIIHGKGTGALRTAIHKMLKNNKCVKDFRLGTFGEGESGVTIIKIK